MGKSVKIKIILPLIVATGILSAAGIVGIYLFFAESLEQ